MRKRTLKQIISWFDNQDNQTDNVSEQVNYLRVVPFILLHASALSIIWVGWSPIAVIIAITFYLLRMVGITVFYHRYFAHKTFKTGRITQFIFALIGSSSTQRGPLWWASHHRHHHHYSDQEQDVHSPKKGLFWSHMGWFLADKHFITRLDLIPDFARFRELMFLDRFDTLVPIACAVMMFILGVILNALFPELGTNGWQMLVWGYVISTIVLLHATFCINSMAHKLGSRRFNTPDTSRNNFALALITLGEGWHNNHHRFPNSSRHGLKWWEVDLGYYLILGLEKLGLVWQVNHGPNQQKIQRIIKQEQN